MLIQKSLFHKKIPLLAWQLDVGQELAAENIPFAHVVLVVEGTLRVSGRDALGNPFTFETGPCRRVVGTLECPVRSVICDMSHHRIHQAFGCPC